MRRLRKVCVCVCVRMDHMSDDAGKTQALCAHTLSSPLLFFLLLLLLSPGSSLIPVKPGPGARGRPPNPSRFSPSHPLHPPHLSTEPSPYTLHSPLHLNHRTFHPPPPPLTYSHGHPVRLPPPHSSTSCLVPASLTQSLERKDPPPPQTRRSNCFMTSQSSTRHCSQVS